MQQETFPSPNLDSLFGDTEPGRFCLSMFLAFCWFSLASPDFSFRIQISNLVNTITTSFALHNETITIFSLSVDISDAFVG